MTRTRRAIAVAMALLLVGVALSTHGAASAPDDTSAMVDRQFHGHLRSSGAQDMVDAIVVLRTQEDVRAIIRNTRALRRAAIISALKARSNADQKMMRALLVKRRAEGFVTTVEPLWIINAIHVVATPAVIAELAGRPEVLEIRPNLKIPAPATVPAATSSAAAEGNIAATGAPAMWDLGFTGQGVVVASLDTGVDPTHPDLASRWRGGTNSWFDPNGEHPTIPVDRSGHGTATMGVAVGGDAGGSTVGMAPGARWIAAKIFDDSGIATAADIHLAFQWILDPDGSLATDDAPDIVNNSWTMYVAGCNLEFQPDMRSLRASGILPVFAAGNNGPSHGTIIGPAGNPEAFSVGSIDGAEVIDPTSSRGPSACGQPVSPLLVAPGVDVRSADLNGTYTTHSGTSMSAAHATGALALLLSALPTTSPERQEAALESGAVDLGDAGADNSYGFGRLDVAGAYQWLLSAPDFGISASPSSAAVPPGGTAIFDVDVTSINGYAGDVALSATGLSPSQANWNLSPSLITAASGTAQLSITTTSSIAPGTYPVTITGLSGQLTRSTTVTLRVLAPPDFGVATTPSSQTVVAGATGSFTVTVTSLNGFTGAVSLSLSGLPGTVGTATFSPSAVTAAGTSQLTISTLATATPGTYPLTIAGTSGLSTRTSTVSLVVTAARDFTVSATPSSITMRRGQSASYTVSVGAVGGFTGNVTLSVQGLPSRSSSSFSSNPIVTAGSSTLIVRTTSSTSRGTFSLRITGVNGTLNHQVTVGLTLT